MKAFPKKIEILGGREEFQMALNRKEEGLKYLMDRQADLEEKWSSVVNFQNREQSISEIYFSVSSLITNILL